MLQVFQRLKNEPTGLAWERLIAAKLGPEVKLEFQQIADTVGRSRATIQTWFGLFRYEGVERFFVRSNARKQEGRHSESSLPKKLSIRKAPRGVSHC